MTIKTVEVAGTPQLLTGYYGSLYYFATFAAATDLHSYDMKGADETGAVYTLYIDNVDRGSRTQTTPYQVLSWDLVGQSVGAGRKLIEIVTSPSQQRYYVGGANRTFSDPDGVLTQPSESSNIGGVFLPYVLRAVGPDPAPTGTLTATGLGFTAGLTGNAAAPTPTGTVAATGLGFTAGLAGDISAPPTTGALTATGLGFSAGLVGDVMVPAQTGTLTATGLGFTAAMAGDTPAPAIALRLGTTATIVLSAGEGYVLTSSPLLLTILDDRIGRPPTTAVVVVSDAQADAQLTFRIDGVQVATHAATSEGFLGPTSIPVNERWVKGRHTLSVSDGSSLAKATFTVSQSAGISPRGIGADTPPVALAPELVLRNGVRSWVLQDLTPGGLGSFVFPFNPTERSGPLVQRAPSVGRTTARDGRHRISGGQEAVLRWRATGVCPDEQTYRTLSAFAALPRRFWLIDEHNRAWKATFEDVQITPRLRTNVNGSLTDWLGDYDLAIAIYNEQWRVPQGQYAEGA